jgi:hypothetical protein
MIIESHPPHLSLVGFGLLAHNKLALNFRTATEPASLKFIFPPSAGPVGTNSKSGPPLFNPGGGRRGAALLGLILLSPGGRLG